MRGFDIVGGMSVVERAVSKTKLLRLIFEFSLVRFHSAELIKSQR